jgi:hypothetical protein
MTTKIETARSVYLKKYRATPKELKTLGFEDEPSIEYIKEAVLETLAEAYVKGDF